MKPFYWNNEKFSKISLQNEFYVLEYIECKSTKAKTNRIQDIRKINCLAEIDVLGEKT